MAEESLRCPDVGLDCVKEDSKEKKNISRWFRTGFKTMADLKSRKSKSRKGQKAQRLLKGHNKTSCRALEQSLNDRHAEHHDGMSVGERKEQADEEKCTSLLECGKHEEESKPPHLSNPVAQAYSWMPEDLDDCFY